MTKDTITSLIVVLEGSQQIENDGKIIVFGNGASIDTVRNLAIEKLAIARNIPLANILLRDGSGNILDGIDQVRQQQVVYVGIKGSIKTTIPGPVKYPFTGSIREILPEP